MEYFARCPTTLSKWARHYLTGQKVPPQLLETALEGTALLPAVDLQMQILYSAVDQVMRLMKHACFCCVVLRPCCMFGAQLYHV